MDERLRNCKAYAAYLKEPEDTTKSSSGGVFYGLASHIIRNGGTCYGAAFSDNLSVQHKRVDSLSELQKLRKSKYVQSRIGDVYKLVKNDLENDKKVLFSGTPCQVAGLRTFLESEHEALYTVDIICHGVPSSKMFNDHVLSLEHEFGKKITGFQFRDKEHGWRPVEVSYSFADDSPKQYRSGSGEDLYFKAFDQYMNLRESCYYCKFRGFNSGADITIGDYWGIEEFHPDFLNSNKGVSAVIIKTDRGQRLWDESNNCFRFIDSSVLNIVRHNIFVYEVVGEKQVHREYVKYFEELIDQGCAEPAEEAINIINEKMASVKIDVFGSYSLRQCVLKAISWDYKLGLGRHFTGTSLATAFGNPASCELSDAISTQNEYRRNALHRDWKKTLDKELSSQNKGSWLIIDFLEDAQTVYRLNDESHILKTEACEDEFDIIKDKIIDTIKCQDIPEDIWKEGCRKLANIINDIYGADHIIIVSLLLSEKFGSRDNQYRYENFEEIQLINSKLRNRYEYLKTILCECKFIDIKEACELYTDKYFRYGCKPQYYSEEVYSKISKKIFEIIGDE